MEIIKVGTLAFQHAASYYEDEKNAEGPKPIRANTTNKAHACACWINTINTCAVRR